MKSTTTRRPSFSIDTNYNSINNDITNDLLFGTMQSPFASMSMNTLDNDTIYNSMPEFFQQPDSPLLFTTFLSNELPPEQLIRDSTLHSLDTTSNSDYISLMPPFKKSKSRSEVIGTSKSTSRKSRFGYNSTKPPLPTSSVLKLHHATTFVNLTTPDLLPSPTSFNFDQNFNELNLTSDVFQPNELQQQQNIIQVPLYDPIFYDTFGMASQVNQFDQHGFIPFDGNHSGREDYVFYQQSDNENGQMEFGM